MAFLSKCVDCTTWHIVLDTMSTVSSSSESEDEAAAKAPAAAPLVHAILLTPLSYKTLFLLKATRLAAVQYKYAKAVTSSAFQREEISE